MPEFPAVTFSGDRDGLFSPDEVKSLMRAECARATRYKYAVTAMRVAVIAWTSWAISMVLSLERRSSIR